MQIEEAIRSRRAVRRFLPEPIPRKIIEDILDIASRAPSGRIFSHGGCMSIRDSLCRDVIEAAKRNDADPGYLYYPDPWFEPYLERRRLRPV